VNIIDSELSCDAPFSLNNGHLQTHSLLDHSFPGVRVLEKKKQKTKKKKRKRR